MHVPDGCEIRAPFVSLLTRPPNTSDRAGRFGCALAVHMSFIPRSPGIETLRAAHHYRGYSMAGLILNAAMKTCRIWCEFLRKRNLQLKIIPFQSNPLGESL